MALMSLSGHSLELDIVQVSGWMDGWVELGERLLERLSNFDGLVRSVEDELGTTRHEDLCCPLNVNQR